MPREIGRTEAQARFWSDVDMTTSHWHHSSMPVGEARLRSWSYTYAPLPDGYWLEVWCGDEECIRPQHTFVGTMAQATKAVRFRQEEKRKSSPELKKDGRKVMTDDDVDRCFELYATGLEHTEIAQLLGFNMKTVEGIIAGRRRKRPVDKETGRTYQMTSDKRTIYWKERYLKNREKILKRMKEKRDANPEYYREVARRTRERSKDKYLKREREYYWRNKEAILERKREVQRLRSKVLYWKERDAEKYNQYRVELENYLKRRNHMSTDKNQDQEEGQIKNTQEGEEIKAENEEKVTPEEARAAHEDVQGFDKPTDQKFPI